MPAVLAGLRRREIAIEMREERSRDVRLRVFAGSPIGLAEIAAAIEDAPPGMARKLFGRDERIHVFTFLLTHSWKCISASSSGDW